MIIKTINQKLQCGQFQDNFLSSKYLLGNVTQSMAWNHVVLTMTILNVLCTEALRHATDVINIKTKKRNSPLFMFLWSGKSLLQRTTDQNQSLF